MSEITTLSNAPSMAIKTTRDLRLSLIQTYEDLIGNKVTPHAARARAYVAQAILNTVRTELVLARTNLTDYKTIDLVAEQST